MSLSIVVRCDLCQATLSDIAPGDLSRTLASHGWVSREGKGRLEDVCPECAEEAGIGATTQRRAG